MVAVVDQEAGRQDSGLRAAASEFRGSVHRASDHRGTSVRPRANNNAAAINAEASGLGVTSVRAAAEDKDSGATVVSAVAMIASVEAVEALAVVGAAVREVAWGTVAPISTP